MSEKQSYGVATQLYLDLLKRTLTGSLFDPEPDANNENEVTFFREFIDHYIKGPAVSMLPLARFDNLQSCIANVVAENIPGDLIETGVWRGGATIFMRAMLKALEVTDRTVWVADSFEGLPEPDAEKFPAEAKFHHSFVNVKVHNNLAVSLGEVQHNFKAYGVLDDSVRFLKGWFKDTLPSAPIDKLAVLRLDGDYYESTIDALTNLYHKVSIGGYVIIDDFGEDSWTYCSKAVEDFRRERSIVEPLTKVDKGCVYWRRTR